MKRLPLLLAPAAKDYLWGGSRLNDDFNLELSCSPLAEAWMCSTHPEGKSALPALSCSLSDFLSAHPDYLGNHSLFITDGRPELPILIKLIDAKSDLSVQVHPDDEAAKQEGQWGKTEMWYVLDVKPRSSLIYGFNRDVEEEAVRKAVKDGSIGSLLNHVPVHRDDVFMVSPGTVHAIGAGILLAEIQQSSNLTYRLYDYGRVGKDGKQRELHVDKAMKVAKLQSSATPRQPMRVLRYGRGYARELLARCRYFQVERMLLNTEVQRTLVPFQTRANSFHALLVVDGCGSISWGDGAMNFFKGDCFFVPAQSEPLRLHGKGQLLDVSC